MWQREREHTRIVLIADDGPKVATDDISVAINDGGQEFLSGSNAKYA